MAKKTARGSKGASRAAEDKAAKDKVATDKVIEEDATEEAAAEEDARKGASRAAEDKAAEDKATTDEAVEEDATEEAAARRAARKEAERERQILRGEKRALEAQILTAEGGMVVDAADVAGPSNDSSNNRRNKLLRRIKKLETLERIIPKTKDETASAARALKQTKADHKGAEAARELRSKINENNRYTLFASMEWQADWLLRMRKHIKNWDFTNFGVCCLCEDRIMNNELSIIKFDSLRIKKSLLKIKEGDSIAVFFSASVTHLKCATPGTMTYLIRRGPTSSLVAVDSFYVHPNVKRSGWDQFMERYGAVLVESDLSTEDMKGVPAISLPQIFWDWAKGIDAGEEVCFSDLEPGDAGKVAPSGPNPLLAKAPTTPTLKPSATVAPKTPPLAPTPNLFSPRHRPPP
ncbi:hypothetical protein BD779DRAFT_1477421 [Infundibulicybe gibba]|nr:hypothetical protein BD779DRAFT_1477421 [Infundibulicybe gibba]